MTALCYHNLLGGKGCNKAENCPKSHLLQPHHISEDQDDVERLIEDVNSVLSSGNGNACYYYFQGTCTKGESCAHLHLVQKSQLSENEQKAFHDYDTQKKATPRPNNQQLVVRQTSNNNNNEAVTDLQKQLQKLQKENQKNSQALAKIKQDQKFKEIKTEKKTKEMIKHATDKIKTERKMDKIKNQNNLDLIKLKAEQDAKLSELNMNMQLKMLKMEQDGKQQSLEQQLRQAQSAADAAKAAADAKPTVIHSGYYGLGWRCPHKSIHAAYGYCSACGANT